MGALLVAMVTSAVVLGPELEHCQLTTPLFLTARVGIIADRCGTLFRSDDGGTSWVRSGSIQRGVLDGRSFDIGIALTDGTLLLGGFLGTRLSRSEDQGVTWSDVPLPSDQWIYAFSTRGQNVWACGSEGHILRSRDSGRSWSKTQKTPTNSDDRCISLDFLDGSRGWAAGWYGSLWSTEDGGASWRRLSLPPAFTAKRANERTLERVLRVDDALGFVSGAAGTFRTRDGGKTWERLEHGEDLPHVPMRMGDAVVLTTRETATLPPGQRVIDLTPALAARGDGAARVSGSGLELLEADGTRRVVGLNGPSRIAPPLPASVRAVTASLLVASSDTGGFVSQDGGQTWRQLTSLPAGQPLGPMWIIGNRRILARSGSKVFRSESLGRDWVETESPLDARDLARGLGETSTDPVSCLEQPKGSLLLSAGEHGCFGGSTSTVRFSWDEDGGSLEVTSDPVESREPVAKFLTRAEAKEALLELHELVLRDEVPSGCWSTNTTQIRLDVTCSDGRQSLKLSTSECGSRPLPPGVGAATRSGRPSGYARANGVMSWALSR